VDSLILCPFALFPLFSIHFLREALEFFLKFREPMSDLPIIQKTYDLIQWYIPILNRLPRDHKFMLGDRMINELYNLGTPDLGGF
jgi:hypothetical protein